MSHKVDIEKFRNDIRNSMIGFEKLTSDFSYDPLIRIVLYKANAKTNKGKNAYNEQDFVDLLTERYIEIIKKPKYNKQYEPLFAIDNCDVFPPHLLICCFTHVTVKNELLFQEKLHDDVYNAIKSNAASITSRSVFMETVYKQRKWYNNRGVFVTLDEPLLSTFHSNCTIDILHAASVSYCEALNTLTVAIDTKHVSANGYRTMSGIGNKLSDTWLKLNSYTLVSKKRRFDDIFMDVDELEMMRRQEQETFHMICVFKMFCAFYAAQAYHFSGEIDKAITMVKCTIDSPLVDYANYGENALQIMLVCLDIVTEIFMFNDVSTTLYQMFSDVVTALNIELTGNQLKKIASYKDAIKKNEILRKNFMNQLMLPNQPQSELIKQITQFNLF